MMCILLLCASIVRLLCVYTMNHVHPMLILVHGLDLTHGLNLTHLREF